MSENRQFSPVEIFKTPPRQQGQQHAIGLKCKPMENVRIAFIGLGMRMSNTLERFMHLEGATISVICDLSEAKLVKAVNLIKSFDHPEPAIYNKPDDWKRICERNDIDLVYISTHYDLHVPIAVYAME